MKIGYMKQAMTILTFADFIKLFKAIILDAINIACLWLLPTEQRAERDDMQPTEVHITSVARHDLRLSDN